MVKRDLKFFMREKEEEIITVPGPSSFKDDEGKVIDLEIRVLSNKEIREINSKYRHRSVATDKKGQPYIANGEVVFKTEKDSERAVRHIIAEALVYPDLKDKALMEFYKCVDITEMPQLVFSRSDEYNHVSNAVMTALGIIDKPDEDELIKDAKN